MRHSQSLALGVPLHPCPPFVRIERIQVDSWRSVPRFLPIPNARGRLAAAQATPEVHFSLRCARGEGSEVLVMLAAQVLGTEVIIVDAVIPPVEDLAIAEKLVASVCPIRPPATDPACTVEKLVLTKIQVDIPFVLAVLTNEPVPAVRMQVRRLAAHTELVLPISVGYNNTGRVHPLGLTAAGCHHRILRLKRKRRWRMVQVLPGPGPGRE